MLTKGTRSKQAALIVEASTVEEARQIVLGDLDAGVYDADCIVFQKEQPISLWDSATILPPSARVAN